jgi:ACR3 family arsenite efflux pump ArsB
MIDEKLAAVLVWEYLESGNTEDTLKIAMIDGRILIIVVKPAKDTH